MLRVEFIGDKEVLHRVVLSLSTQWSLQFTGLSDELTQSLRDWVNSYQKGTAVPFRAPNGSLFQNQVWKALVEVPFGTTLSYRQLSIRIGSPNAARAVGTACGQNPWPLLVPCHRIIRTNGNLGGFAFGPEVKERLLDFEREQMFPFKRS